MQQWLTTTYLERAAGDTPKLTKYCEVVCDLSNEVGEIKIKARRWTGDGQNLCHCFQANDFHIGSPPRKSEKFQQMFPSQYLEQHRSHMQPE